MRPPPISSALVPNEHVGLTIRCSSVVIFVASLLLGQRLLEQFSLTSLLHSNWRQVIFWSSKMLLPAACLSAVTIFTLYAAGTALLATDNSSVGTSNQLEVGLLLLKISVSWLFVFGAIPVILVVLVMATSRIVPSREDNLAIKLTVFLLGAVMLITGQGVHLSALIDPELVGGKIAFYLAGFTPELLVVMLYALDSLDMLFAGESPDWFVHGKDAVEGGLSRADEKPEKAIIIVRKDFDLFVANLETTSRTWSTSTTPDEPERISRNVERIRGFGEHLVCRGGGSRKLPPMPLR